MTRANFSLTKEPRRELYAKLIDYLTSKSGTALLVVRDREDLGSDALSLLRNLEPFLVERKRSRSWPGTTLEDDESEVLHYELTPDCVRLLKAASSRLYRWQHPLLPEDICFLRANGEPWFTSIAHEHDAYFTLSQSEFETLVAEVPEVARILRKDEILE